jgi:hypothetical protein
VEGLQPSQVTIVDASGRMLAGGDDQEGLPHLSMTQLEFQRNLERELEQKIQSLLERAVGPQRAMVRVSATVDFQRVESTQEVFDPTGTVIRSEQRGHEKSSGSAGSPSGPPGVASNVPGSQTVTPALTNASEMQKQNETVNYEVSKSVKHVLGPVGKIKRLSAAVRALQELDPRTLLSLIGNEHPQIVAFIIAHLLPNTAAQVLSGLSEAQRADVLTRIIHLEALSPEVITEIEGVLMSKMSSMRGLGNQKVGGCR